MSLRPELSENPGKPAVVLCPLAPAHLFATRSSGVLIGHAYINVAVVHINP